MSPLSLEGSFDSYIEDAVRTDLSDEQYREAYLRMWGVFRFQHAVTGLTTEVGEVADQLKKHVYYGKELDKVNLKEEGGDLFWYLALFCDELEQKYGIKAQEILNTNIEKLRARYPDKFTGEQAINRDTVEERKILEQFLK